MSGGRKGARWPWFHTMCHLPKDLDCCWLNSDCSDISPWCECADVVESFLLLKGKGLVYSHQIGFVSEASGALWSFLHWNLAPVRPGQERGIPPALRELTMRPGSPEEEDRRRRAGSFFPNSGPVPSPCIRPAGPEPALHPRWPVPSIQFPTGLLGPIWMCSSFFLQPRAFQGLIHSLLDLQISFQFCFFREASFDPTKWIPCPPFFKTFFFFYADRFKSHYWIHYSIASVFMFWLQGMWDPSSLTRDWPRTPLHWKAKSLTTGAPGNSQFPAFT